MRKRKAVSSSLCSVSPVHLGSDSSVFNLILLPVGFPSTKIKIHSIAPMGRGVSGLSVVTALVEPACLLPCSSLRLLENRACVEWIKRI